MKKILILIMGLLPFFTFTACEDKDDIQKDVDELNARLDAVETELEALNSSIQHFQEALNGKILITGYKKNEKGDYTLSLSNGEELVVFGGQPQGEIPTLGINKDGNWIYTLDGVTKVVVDEKGNPCPAKPQDGKDGKTPTISIDKDGYWCYAIGDGAPKRIGGKYNIAQIGKIPASIFAEVGLKDNKLSFKLGEETVEIPLLGGLDLEFPEQPVKVMAGKSVKLTVKQVNVYKAVIDPTPLQVTLSNNEKDNLTIVAKGVEKGKYTVYFQLFTKEGYRLIKPLEVTVE